MLWLQQFYRRRGRNVIWLIEEPESFLHPSLISAQSKILSKLSEEASVLYTTHSLGFIPSHKNDILGIKKDENRTSCITYRTTFEATESLRKNFGVKLGHFFNLADYTVGVEGPRISDIWSGFCRDMV
jgi:predicted ATP-dependent endonuclease of OLD family